MKRKPNPQKADRENPAWTKETFGRPENSHDLKAVTRTTVSVVNP
jgi:hypothetical protein